MNLSVPCNFDPTLINSLSKFKHIKEIYGKLTNDWIGGGRSTYTLPHVTISTLKRTIQKCHEQKIGFNYLLNAASLYGLEQTRNGQKRIRRTLDFLSECKVDTITVSVPYLAKLIITQYPHFRVKTGVFARISDVSSARAWEDLGVHEICISAIGTNRNFKELSNIRKSVNCDLQLLVNASCQTNCIWEYTHMHLLSQSSSRGSKLGTFCLDYCFLQCSERRLADPVSIMKSAWIRPEDLHFYESIGYSNFKIVERSSPTDLLLKRITAYENRSFDGNFWELIAPVAMVTQSLQPSIKERLRTAFMLAKPWHVKLKTLLTIKKYTEQVMDIDFSKENSSIYIDNKSVDGFLDYFRDGKCDMNCKVCDYCSFWADRTLQIKKEKSEEILKHADLLMDGLYSGSHW